MGLTTDDKTWIRGTIIEALEDVVLPRFDEHDKRFDDHDKRFDEHDKRFDDHDSQFREIREELRQIRAHQMTIEGRLEALENDIKELYKMISGRDNTSLVDKKFATLPPDQKLLIMHRELQATAKQLGVVLPQS
ncbi:MAG: hypothetical protein WBB39_04960 [Candidatus Saccharimonadales bacterium]